MGVGIVIGCVGGGLSGCMVVCVIFVDGGVSAGECDVYVSGVSASELC